MGNLHSYDKDTVVHHLWKVLRAIPVLPINPNLAPLRVLTKQKDGYHDAGSVASVCKRGAGKNSLRSLLKPSREEYFTTGCIGEQTYTISDDHGARAIANLLFGEVNAAAWFSRAKSIAVYIPECWVHEFKIENWEEMLQHFDPDMSQPFLGEPDWNGKRKLYIVQKVVLVRHVQITASYRTTAGLDFNLMEAVPGGKMQTEVEVHGEETAVFTLSATKKDQKLPIAFSGLRYTYDRFGVREAKQGELTRNQPDTAGANSSHDKDNENDEDDEVVDEETAAIDGDMADFFEDEDDDWRISVISSHGHDEEDDDPAPDPASSAGSPPRDLEETN